MIMSRYGGVVAGIGMVVGVVMAAVLLGENGLGQLDHFLKLFDEGFKFGVAWICLECCFNGLELCGEKHIVRGQCGARIGERV